MLQWCSFISLTGSTLDLPGSWTRSQKSNAQDFFWNIYWRTSASKPWSTKLPSFREFGMWNPCAWEYFQFFSDWRFLQSAACMWTCFGAPVLLAALDTGVPCWKGLFYAVAWVRSLLPSPRGAIDRCNTCERKEIDCNIVLWAGLFSVPVSTEKKFRWRSDSPALCSLGYVIETTIIRALVLHLITGWSCLAAERSRDVGTTPALVWWLVLNLVLWHQSGKCWK